MWLKWRGHSPKIYAGLGVGMLMFVLAFSSLSVQGASSIGQGFQTTETNIVEGALVSLKTDGANAVELSNTERASQLIGIVGDKPLIELSNDGNTVQVVTSGITNALVSDINGEVKAGDKVTASPIEGVGMKATESGIVVGTAQADLDKAQTSQRTISTKDGKQETVKIGMIPVQVDTIFYVGTHQGSSFLPSALQDVANTIAGRNVSPVRVIVAALLLVLLFASIIVLLYSAVKSSIISIGRNPLSENAVHKSLFQVGLTIVGLLAFTVILVYLILTL